ncbi:MDR family MFS transporter [soil metagenome]
MTSTLTPTAGDRTVTGRHLNLISLVLVLGAITSLLDTTIVNIALKHLQVVFAATVAQTQWVTTAYLLAYVAVIPVSGWASERFGARRMWMFAVGLFMIGSLACGFAVSLPELVAFRVLQGLGGGMILPITITILTRAAGRERIGRAIATIGLIGQLAPILGPVIGGSIVQSAGWNWLFFVNIPICFAALVLAAIILPMGERHPGTAFDFLGFALLTPGIVALAFGISRATGAGGFTAIDTWLPLAIGVVLVALFSLHSLRARRPALLDVRVFARRSFGLSSVITFVAGFSIYALMLLLPLFYQQVRGESVLATGLLLIPQGLGTMCFILINRRLGGRIDTRLVIVGGVLLTMIGILPFLFAGTSGADVLLLLGQFLQGFGMGAVSLPVMTLAFASLSHAETPRGSAAFNVVQRVGAPFGVTVIAVVLQGYLAGAGTAGQIASAFAATFWWVFALSAVPLLLAFFLPAPQRKPDAVALHSEP